MAGKPASKLHRRGAFGQEMATEGKEDLEAAHPPLQGIETTVEWSDRGWECHAYAHLLPHMHMHVQECRG